MQQRTGLSESLLAADEDLSNIVLMDLQQAVHASIDLAIHVYVDESVGAPAQSAQAFDLLQKAGWIDSDLALRLVGAIAILPDAGAPVTVRTGFLLFLLLPTSPDVPLVFNLAFTSSAGSHP